MQAFYSILELIPGKNKKTKRLEKAGRSQLQYEEVHGDTGWIYTIAADEYFVNS